jgi:ABC-type multidrug transport system ATPase subunit
MRAPELARGAGAIGLVTHLPHLYTDLSAAENLLYFARLQRVAEPRARVAALLAQFGLARTGELAVGRFSRGMQQRLALARALLSAPALLLLDEPFSGLDQEGIADLTECLVALRREGLTLVLSTHQLEIAEPLAEQVLCLARGTVAWRGARGAEPLAAIYRRVYARPPAAVEAP